MLVSRISPVELGTDPARPPNRIISGYSPSQSPGSNVSHKTALADARSSCFFVEQFCQLLPGAISSHFLEMCATSKGVPGGKASAPPPPNSVSFGAKMTAGMLKVQ